MEIAFENVSFSYENTEKLAIKDISFNIRQGEKIALVGPSGGSKSITSCLLARF